LEDVDPILFHELFSIAKLVTKHMFENGIISNLDSDFVLSVLDTTSNKCVAQDIHTDFNLNDTEIVNDPNIKLVLIPLANEMFLRVVKKSHMCGFETSLDKDGIENHHYKHATVVPIQLGQYICLDPKLWHSGWTTKYNVNYRMHLYVGFNKQSLETVSQKYASLTPGSNYGDNLFFRLTENAMQYLNGTYQKEVLLNAVFKHNQQVLTSRKRVRSANGKFVKKEIKTDEEIIEE